MQLAMLSLYVHSVLKYFRPHRHGLVSKVPRLLEALRQFAPIGSITNNVRHADAVDVYPDHCAGGRMRTVPKIRKPSDTIG